MSEDFTELVDADIDRVDLVDKAANGTTFLLAKRAADGDSPALFEPDFVRDMIAKAEGDPATPGESVTVTGSPAAIARMMHQAAAAHRVVKAADGEYVAFVKAKYSAEDKRKLASQGHAMTNSDGEPDYPIDDEEDLGKAIKAVGRGGADHDKIRKYVIGRAKSMGKSDQIPDNWASDGSLKQAVSKADGDPTDPGSPAWESQDAANADTVVAKILGCIPAVKALAMREATEVGAGHLDDIGDVFQLQGAIDQLTCAAQAVAAFAVSERVEAGAVSKAQPPAAPTTAATAATSSKENTVDTTTTTEVAKTEATAAAGTEQPVSKAAALAAQLGITPEQLAEIGAQHVLKAAAEAAGDTKTTGAEVAPTDARTIPGTDTVQSPVVAATDEVSKAAATQLATAFGEAVAPVVKQLGELTTQVNAQLERVEKMAAQPDDRRSPVLNGATGEPGPAQRGVTATPEYQTIVKAIDDLPEGPARDELKRGIALKALASRFGG